MRKVIYTSIFGGYDTLKDPIFLPKGYDFIAFTDMNLESSVWDIRKKPTIYTDNTRNANLVGVCSLLKNNIFSFCKCTPFFETIKEASAISDAFKTTF